MAKTTPQKWIKFSLNEQLYEKIKNRKHKQLADNVREDLEAFYALLNYGFALARKKLTPKEAMLILDVMNGHLYTPSLSYMYAETGLITSVEDGCVLEDLDKKWGIDKVQLIEKLKSLPGYARLALVDWAVGVWEQKPESINEEELKKVFKG